MNDIVHLIFSYTNIKTFYDAKNTFNLNEKLYWKGKELPMFADAISTGILDLVKFLHSEGKSSTNELLKIPDCFIIKPGMKNTPAVRCILLSKTTRHRTIAEYVFDVAVEHNYYDIVKYLYTINFSGTYWSARIACLNDNVRMLSLLNSHKCPLMHPDLICENLIHICYRLHSKNCLKYLDALPMFAYILNIKKNEIHLSY